MKTSDKDMLVEREMHCVSEAFIDVLVAFPQRLLENRILRP